MANREIQRAWEKFIQNGSTREQWKYKLALSRLKKEQAEQDQPRLRRDLPKRTQLLLLRQPLRIRRRRRQNTRCYRRSGKLNRAPWAAEKQRIEYEIKNSTGATRKQWEYKLVLWRREEAQAEQDQAAAKARLSSSRGRSGTP
jgi:hypothetical protein